MNIFFKQNSDNLLQIPHSYTHHIVNRSEKKEKRNMFHRKGEIFSKDDGETRIERERDG